MVLQLLRSQAFCFSRYGKITSKLDSSVGKDLEGQLMIYFKVLSWNRLD
jgi:hypothetical protein